MFTVNVYGGYNDSDSLNQGLPYSNPNILPGTFNTTVPTFPTGTLSSQNKEWHRFYCNTNQAFLQLAMELSFAEITDLSIAYSDWILHAMILWVGSAGRLQS